LDIHEVESHFGFMLNSTTIKIEARRGGLDDEF